MSLTDDEVRERFSAYLDGELPEGEAAFVKKRLADDAKLEAEYAAFKKMMSGLASMSLESANLEEPPPDAPRVDLLGGVQKRLHKRSAGRFYGTRWSRAVGIFPLEALAAVVLVMLVVLYVCLTYISGLKPAGSGGSGSGGSGGSGGATTQPR